MSFSKTRMTFAPDGAGTSAPPAASPSAPSSPAPASASPSPGTGTPAGVAASEPASPSENVDIQALMRFDPFAPEPAAPEPAVQEPAPPVQPTAPVAGGAPAPAPAAPVVAPGAEPADVKIARLEGELNALRAPQPAQPKDESDPLPLYDFQVPDQLMQLLGSESLEERKAGIKHVMRGTARSVHQLVLQEVAQTLPSVISMMTQQAIKSAEVQRSFYSKYPALKDEVFRPAILSVAQGILKERNASEWTEDLGDAIAQATFKKLGIMQAPAQAPAPAAPAAPPPPAMLPGNTRPAPSYSVADEIMDLVR